MRTLFTEKNRNVLTGFKILIERFANCTSLDDFFEALNNIYRDSDQDVQLRRWFRHVNSYIRCVYATVLWIPLHLREFRDLGL